MNRIVIALGLLAALAASSVAFFLHREAFFAELPAAIAVAGVEVALIVGLLEALRQASERRKWGPARSYIKARMKAPDVRLERLVRISFGIGSGKPNMFKAGGLYKQFGDKLFEQDVSIGSSYITPALTSEHIIGLIWLERFNRSAEEVFSAHRDERLALIFEHGLSAFDAESDWGMSFELDAELGEWDERTRYDRLLKFNEDYLASTFSHYRRLVAALTKEPELSAALKSVSSARVGVDLLVFFIDNFERVVRASASDEGAFSDKNLTFAGSIDRRKFPISASQ